VGQKEPRRHHYVPELLLKNFADLGGKLWGYDAVKRKKFCTDPQAAGVKADFHTVRLKAGKIDRLTIEQMLSTRVEGPGKLALTRLVNREELTDQQALDFIQFVATQFVRTPTAFAQRSALIAPTLQESLKRMAKFDAEYKRRVTERLAEKHSQEEIDRRFDHLQNGKIIVVPTREFLLRLMLDQIIKVTKELSRMRWNLATLDDSDPDLIIGDHPVTLHDLAKKGARSTRALGLRNANVELMMPVSRRMAAIAYNSNELPPMYTLLESGTAEELNDRTMRAAQRFVYASTESDEILKRFIQLHGTGPTVRTTKLPSGKGTLFTSELR